MIEYFRRILPFIRSNESRRIDHAAVKFQPQNVKKTNPILTKLYIANQGNSKTNFYPGQKLTFGPQFGQFDAAIVYEKYAVGDLKDKLYSIGLLAKHNLTNNNNNKESIWLVDRRVEFLDFGLSNSNPPNQVTYKFLHDKEEVEFNDNVLLEFQKYQTKIRDILSKLEICDPKVPEDNLPTDIPVKSPREFSNFLDRCVLYLPISGYALQKQKIIQTLDLSKRAEAIIDILTEQSDIKIRSAEIQKGIDKEEETKEDILLRREKEKIEKLLIQQQPSWVNHITERLEKRVYPENVLAIIKENLHTLQSQNARAYTGSPLHDYLDLVTTLPWGTYTVDNFDIKHAKTVLDNDHYGITDIKERILEFIATGARTGLIRGKILCFVGPPGTGKTSIGQSIATALNRKFHRFSVGGIADSSEIKGHRRTFVASRPGKFINAIKLAQSSNPVILIDEIDKVGRDASHSLLEVLDPSQNSTFLDFFLDIPYNLSDVLFICTANNMNKIIPPLLDRLDIIEIQGYMFDEKLKIASNHIIPKEISRIGLTPEAVTISEESIRKLIKLYSPEPGVRSIKKYIQRIFSKACLKMYREKLSTMHIDIPNFDEIMKDTVPPTRRYFSTLPVGVATSIINTDFGAIIQYVESSINPGEKENKIKSTGSVGNIISEGTSISYAFAKRFLATLGDTSFFKNNAIHVHFPAGAFKKDCSSIGAAIVSSLLSRALNIQLNENIVIIGEITLSGNILHINSIKEILIEVQRESIKEIILPKANYPEWEELEPTLKEGITVHFVEKYQQIWAIISQDKTQKFIK